MLWIYCIITFIIFYIALINLCWLSAHAVHDKGGGLRNCLGFVNGTVCPICRSNERILRILYNGHRGVHALKFQSLVAPNRLLATSTVQWKEWGMAVECWLMALCFVYIATQPIHWELMFKDPLKVIFHRNKRTLKTLWKLYVCLLSEYLNRS